MFSFPDGKHNDGVDGSESFQKCIREGEMSLEEIRKLMPFINLFLPKEVSGALEKMESDILYPTGPMSKRTSDRVEAIFTAANLAFAELLKYARNDLRAVKYASFCGGLPKVS